MRSSDYFISANSHRFSQSLPLKIIINTPVIGGLPSNDCVLLDIRTTVSSTCGEPKGNGKFHLLKVTLTCLESQNVDRCVDSRIYCALQVSKSNKCVILETKLNKNFRLALDLRPILFKTSMHVPFSNLHWLPL